MAHAYLDNPIAYFGVSLLFGAAVATLFVFMLRAQANKWAFLFPALLAIALAYVANPTHRIAAFHGFYHSAIVYQILNGEIPPRDPFMGDATLSYPWAANMVTAGLVWLTGLSVSWVFAMVNLAALCVTLMLFYVLSGYFFEESPQRILATAMAFFGATFLPESLYTLLLQEHGILLEIHGTIPIIRRFSNMSAMSVGITLFTAYTLVLIRTLTSDRPGFVWYATAFGTVFLCGVLYPFALVALAALGAGAGIAVLLTKGRRGWAPLVATGLASALGAACALPLLLSYMGERVGGSSFAVTTNSERLMQKVLQDILILWPVLLLLVAIPHAVREWHRRDRLRSRIVLTGCVALLLLHLLVTGPDSSEAKWRAFGLVLLAIGAAAPMHGLVRTKPLIAGLVLCLFFSLAMGDLAWKLTRPNDIGAIAREQGQYLESTNPQENAVYSWIAQNTPRHALLMDRNVNGCVFGRRALYVAMPMQSGTPLVGWTYSPYKFMNEIHGHGSEAIQRRRAHVNAILAGTDTQTRETALTEAARLPYPLFIVCHSPEERARVEALGGSVTERYTFEDSSVFECQKRNPGL